MNSSPRSSNISGQKTETASPVIIRAKKGLSVSWKGLTLLSTIDPAAQGEKAAAASPVHERTLYLCPSPLFGYGLETLASRLGSDSVILCLETEPALFELSRKYITGLASLSPSEAADPAAVCRFVRQTWGARAFRRVELVRLTGGWRLDAEAYEQAAAALRKDIAIEWGNALTMVKLGRRYARNTIRNLARLPRSGALPQFGNAPVLVLGAGPSLDAFLDTLEAARMPGERTFRIICVDTALPCLTGRRVRPDLVVALECQHWNLRDFLGQKPTGPRASPAPALPLAMDLSALPAGAEALGGDTAFFFTRWADLQFLDRVSGLAARFGIPELPPLGSVGLSTIALALKLGTGPVIIAGLDFAFDMDRYHARSSPGHVDRLRRQDRFHGLVNAQAAFRPGAVKTTGKNGEKCRTDGALQSYRDLLERTFAAEERLFDTDGPGLPLGLRRLSVEEAESVLRGGAPGAVSGGNAETRGTDSVAAFLRTEIDALRGLRAILSGERQAAGELAALLDFCDYLWASFPDYSGRRPGPEADISFLKRVRAELDPYLTLFTRTLAESDI